jgi:signal transduction histidine kinase/ligand-binding sensor domain-containing protein/CheY-like chemotaxis protein
MNPKYFVLLLFVLMAAASFGPTKTVAQSNLIVEDITDKSLLPNGSVNCMIQDSTGFIWMGTWKGLFRYDGYRAINFSYINPKFNALKINALHIKNNKLWVGSFVTGLFCIDLGTYQISNYSTQNDPNKTISDDNVLTIESLDDGTILAGTERGGVNIIHPNKPIEIITTSNTPQIIQKDQVSQIVHFGNRDVIIASHYLMRYNIDTKKAERFNNHYFEAYITKIVQLSNAELLVATNDGLFWVNQNTVKQLLDIRPNFIEKTKSGNSSSYLIGTIEGIFELNGKTLAIKPFFNNPGESYKQVVTSILVTNDDALLIGSETGLSMFTQRKQHFNHITTAQKNDGTTSVSKIMECKTNMYVGTWGKGVMTIDASTNKLQPVRFSNFNDAPPRFIYDMDQHNNQIYLSCKNYHGIFWFNPEETTPKLNYTQFFTDEKGSNRMFVVTAIYKAQSGRLFLGTWEGLLFVYDENQQNFVALATADGKLPQSENLSIFSIIEDNAGDLWVGINGGGVLNLRVQNNTIVSEKQFTEKDGLISNFVTQLYQTRNNTIWIGTEKGLSMWENNQLTSVFNSNLDFDIQSLIEDPIGFLWIGTPKGLIRLNSNRIDEPFKLFDQADGLKNKSFLMKSCATDKNLNFYFGGLNGIDHFAPYKIEYNYKKPKPVITQFTLFNKNIYPIENQNETILKRNIQFHDKLTLKYNQNTFSLEVSNLEYQIQDKCQFAFLLEGADKSWNYRDSRNRVAYYTNLAPGTYTFKVKSTNNDGVWCDQPVELQIEIKPPFWATTWAYITYFIAAMLAIFYLSYQWLMKVNQKHRIQIKELEFRKQKELDEVKLRFFTNISHEFRTPLTLILGPIARILETDPNNVQHDIHLMIYRNANRLLQLTNRILDFRKNEKEQLLLKVEYIEIEPYIDNIFQFFTYEAQKRNIAYRYECNYRGKAWIDTEFAESMIFNILSNAFKYTPDGRSITLKINSKNDKIELSFADTGTGMKPEQLEKIFDRYHSSSKRNSTGIGLSFTKRLIELHKGEITVQSQWEKGTEVTLVLPATDVYTDTEKVAQITDKQQIDWSKVNPTTSTEMNREIGQLKSQFKKDELIALLVDDNFEVRQFLHTLLEGEFKVIEASNGEEGLSLAFEHLPDIVISDVMMPVMGGFEFCEKLKTDPRTDHIPIILTTILSDQPNRLTALSKGADSYIPKPIDPEHLLIRVRKLIEKQLKLKDRFNLNNYETDIKPNEPEPVELHPLIEKARKVVLENIDNSEYNIDDFCNDLELSRMQLYRKFKALTGMSANSFIRKVRLHRAAEMLKEGKMSVKEVTYDVGFTDLKYFRKCFFEEFGVNPSEYNEIE